jgi:ferric-dicitrate binding protein FerR (iron transport regulator)
VRSPSDDAILIVRADELPPAYEWIAPAKYQQIACAKADKQWQQRFTRDPKPPEADDALNARADYHAGADEQFARVTEEGSSLEPDAAHHSSTELTRPTPRSRPWLRGIIGLVLAACIIAAAFVSQSSYGDAAKLLIARWTPERLLARPTPQNPATP